jgi:hypothetical protein
MSCIKADTSSNFYWNNWANSSTAEERLERIPLICHELGKDRKKTQPWKLLYTGEEILQTLKDLVNF